MLIWVTKIQCRILSHIIIVAKTVFSDVSSCRDLIRTNKTLSWPFVRKFHNVHIVLSIKKTHYFEFSPYSTKCNVENGFLKHKRYV